METNFFALITLNFYIKTNLKINIFLYKMKVYQGCIDYFFGHVSGYGSVRTHFGNVFSTLDLCLIDLEKTIQLYDVKDWYIYQYDLDKSTEPILVKK